MNGKRTALRPTRSKWLLLALAAGITFLQGQPSERLGSLTFDPGFGPRVASANTSDLAVTINSTRIVMKYNYVEADATMSGRVRRSDGSEGSYKVPITLFYPVQSQNCNRTGIVDVVNSVFYETFAFVGTDTDPFFPSLFAFADLLIGEEFMFGSQHGGYVYAQVQWNKLVIERQRAAGTLLDDTLHIDAGTDGYQILADASRFLRDPSQLYGRRAGAAPCSVDDVIAFGYSQTGELLRNFYLRGLNSSLATAAVFDSGLVFEGAIHAVGGGSCRAITDNAAELWYSYSSSACSGATPANQGKVFTVNTETDVEILEGWQARGGAADQAHYRTYEIAGTSHIPSSLFDLKGLGLKPVDAPVQNYADTGPVFRAMMENLNRWIKQGVEPPVSATIAGHLGSLRSPLFSERSWGNHGRQVLVADVGPDGNALGGIRLPHVRTAETGAPLGVSRGTECFNDPTSVNYLMGCQDSVFYHDAGDAAIYAMNGGTFKPYTEFNPSLCAQLYPDHGAYVAAVAGAADAAAQQHWILADEVNGIVAEAESRAAQFGGCVPPAQP